MSFFKKEIDRPAERRVQPQEWKVNKPAERGSRGVKGLDLVKPTLAQKAGKASQPIGGNVLDRSPAGVLFKMHTGRGSAFVDEYGFWCESDGKPGAAAKVYRNPPRKISLLMDKEQKRLLQRARERGVKKGIR